MKVTGLTLLLCIGIAGAAVLPPIATAQSYGNYPSGYVFGAPGDHPQAAVKQGSFCKPLTG